MGDSSTFWIPGNTRLWNGSDDISMTGSRSIVAFAAELALTTVPVAAADRQEALKHQLEVTRFVVQRLLTLVVVGFGFVGNAVNIVVLTRRWMKSSTNYYLSALAVYDTLYLLLALTMSFAHYGTIKHAVWYNLYRIPFGRPITDVCSNTGVWLTVTFTVERYIGVCYPMKGRVWCTPKRAKYIIVAVCLAAFLLTLPEFFEDTASVTLDRDNRTTVDITKTDFANRESYEVGYYYFNQVAFTFFPLLLLLVFNGLLIRTVMAAARQRRAMTSTSTTSDTAGGNKKVNSHAASDHRNERHGRDQQRITVMLIVVVIVFLVCQLPQAVQKLYMVYLSASKTLTLKKRLILTITGNYFNLLVMMNCSTNFVLYSSFSAKFRMTFARIFCRCLPGSKKAPSFLLTDMSTTVAGRPSHFDGTGHRLSTASCYMQEERSLTTPATPVRVAGRRSNSDSSTCRMLPGDSSCSRLYVPTLTVDN